MTDDKTESKPSCAEELKGSEIVIVFGFITMSVPCHIVHSHVPNYEHRQIDQTSFKL